MTENTPRERLIHFPGFEYDGKRVTNPTASDGGPVSPAHYGFEKWQMGGGCTAWGMFLPDGMEAIVTDLDGTSHELHGPGEPFLVGLRVADEYEEVGIWTMSVGVVYGKDDQPENEQYVPSVPSDGAQPLPRG